MTDYPIAGQFNGNSAGTKTFTPYVPPTTKTYQPFTPTTVPILSPPNLVKIDSKG